MDWLPLVITMLITLAATLLVAGGVVGVRVVFKKHRLGEIDLNQWLIAFSYSAWVPINFPVTSSEPLPEKNDGFPQDM